MKKDDLKNFKDFEKVFNKQMEINLNSVFTYTRENALKLSLHYCYGYFESSNSNEFKTINLILKALKNGS